MIGAQGIVMLTRSDAHPRVHLHWVRETPSRGLQSPISQSFDSPAALPAPLREPLYATGLTAIELHLPPYRPSKDYDANTWLKSLHFQQDAAGRLSAVHPFDPAPPVTAAFHQAAVLVSRAITGDTTPLTLLTEPARSPLLRQPLSRRHVCTPCGGWREAPAERSHFYAPVYRAFAQAAQTALRELLYLSHFESVTDFEDRPHSLAMLSWSGASPVIGRYVDQLGVDVLDNQSMARARAGMASRIVEPLAEVYDLLGRHGARPLIRESYNPAKAVAVVRHCHNHPLHLKQLFQAEKRLLTAFIGLLCRLPSWKDRANGNPALIYREFRSAWEDLEVYFRNFYQRRSYPAAASLLVLRSVQVMEEIDYNHNQ